MPNGFSENYRTENYELSIDLSMNKVRTVKHGIIMKCNEVSECMDACHQYNLSLKGEISHF